MDELEASVERAVHTMANGKMPDMPINTEVVETVEPPRTLPMATLTEQLAVFERASAELRKRMQEERQRIVADFDRRIAEYEANVRATIIEMRATHEHELQAHDRIVKRFSTLG